MCDPVSLLLLASVGVAAKTTSDANTAAAERDAEAARVKAEADRSKSRSDLDTRAGRYANYRDRRIAGAGKRNPFADASGDLFSPRSFFQAG